MAETKLVKAMSVCMIFSVVYYVIMILSMSITLIGITSMEPSEAAEIISEIGSSMDYIMVRNAALIFLMIFTALAAGDIFLLISGFRIWHVKALISVFAISFLFSAIHIILGLLFMAGGGSIIVYSILPVIHIVYTLCWSRFIGKRPKDK